MDLSTVFQKKISFYVFVLKINCFFSKIGNLYKTTALTFLFYKNTGKNPDYVL